MITFFIVATAAGILYERYLKKYFPDKELDKYELIKKHLLEEGNTKPILWVHSEYEINSRNWGSFYSRNNKDLNQEYINLCIETIIKYNGDSFNVFLIDDNAFEKLLPEWNIDLNKVSGILKKNLRLLGITQLLYKYGGMTIPNSTVIFKDMKQLYNKSIEEKDMFIGEMINKNLTNQYISFMGNTKVMGCKKNSKNMKKLISYLEELYSTDNTNEQNIVGDVDRKLFSMVQKEDIKLICGTLLGTKTKDGKRILIDDLINNSYLNLSKKIYCIVVDKDMLMKRAKYNWFIKLNKEGILASNTLLGKYILISKGYDML